MGPGFGDEIGKALVTLIVAVALGALVVGGLIAILGQWLFRHLSVGWN